MSRLRQPLRPAHMLAMSSSCKRMRDAASLVNAPMPAPMNTRGMGEVTTAGVCACAEAEATIRKRRTKRTRWTVCSGAMSQFKKRHRLAHAQEGTRLGGSLQRLRHAQQRHWGATATSVSGSTTSYPHARYSGSPASVAISSMWVETLPLWLRPHTGQMIRRPTCLFARDALDRVYIARMARRHQLKA